MALREPLVIRTAPGWLLLRFGLIPRRRRIKLALKVLLGQDQRVNQYRGVDGV